MCVTYLIRPSAEADASGEEVLLGLKRTGLGAGLRVGLGGKLEPGESARQAAVREIAEESGIVVRPQDLLELGSLRYEFPHRPAWSQHSTAFIVREFSGEAQETEEITPAWFPLDAPPLDRMWHDARFWLPRLLTGERIDETYVFGPDNATVAERRNGST